MRKNSFSVKILLILCILMAVPSLSHAIPPTISYQGYLTDSEGAPLSGNFEIAFSLYEQATGGTALWSETRMVSVHKGVFQVVLGEINPINLSFDSPYWLGIRIEGEELTPRQPLSSVGYAYKSVVSDRCLEGVPDNGGELRSLIVRDDTVLASENGKVIIGSLPSALAQLTVMGDTVKNPARNGGIVAMGSYGRGPDLLVSGAGTRLVWYPKKAAFRAGEVTGSKWDDPNIGDFSLAGGYETEASGRASVAMGFLATARGDHSMAVGRNVIADGDNSIALGYFAYTNGHKGSFVFGDACESRPVAPSADNQFVVRASGGVIFYSNHDQTSGVNLPRGSNTWYSISSRDLKENCEDVNPQEVLKCLASMKIQRWNYKSTGPSEKHMWPYAEDFWACYGLGVDDKHVTAEDMAGVAMVAIQGLYQLVRERGELIKEQQEEIEEQRREIEELKKRLSLIEAMIKSLGSSLSMGEVTCER